MTTERDFDVVIDALQQRIDSLWKITESNMNIGMFGVMDQIRLEQIDQLKDAIALWEKS